MPLDFPSSPTNGQTYTFGFKTWTYNGTSWTLSTTTNVALTNAAQTFTATQTFSNGISLSGTSSPLTVNSSVGTSGQVLTSAGAGATPTWTTVSSGATLSTVNIWSALQTFIPSSTTTSAQVLQGLSNQVADLQQIKNSSLSALGGVNAIGQSYIGSSILTPNAYSYLIYNQTPTYSSPNITLTTGSTHYITPGQTIKIINITPSGYNGTWVAQAGTTGNTLVIPVGSNPGPITAAGSISYSPQLSITATNNTSALVAKSSATYIADFQDGSGNSAAYISSYGQSKFNYGLNVTPGKDNAVALYSSVSQVAVTITGATYVPDKNSYWIVNFTTTSTIMYNGNYNLFNNSTLLASGVVMNVSNGSGSFTTTSWTPYTGAAQAYYQSTPIQLSHRSSPTVTELVYMGSNGTIVGTLTVQKDMTVYGTMSSPNYPITANKINYTTINNTTGGGNVVNSTINETNYTTVSPKFGDGSAQLARISLSADKNISATTWTRVFGSGLLPLTGTYMFNGAIQVVTQATNTAAKVLVKLYWQGAGQLATMYALASGEIYLPAVSGLQGIGIVPISTFMDSNINYIVGSLTSTMINGYFTVEIYSTAAITVKRYPLDDYSPYTANTNGGTVYNPNGVATYINMQKIG